MHQVDIDTAKTRFARGFDCRYGLLIIMNTAKRLKLISAKALHTYRKPINTHLEILGKWRMFKRARIGLHGNLDIISKIKTST